MTHCRARHLGARLVHVFKHMFSIFKQYYMYFHTFFHSHVFSKNTNNVTKITLPNGSQMLHHRGNYHLCWYLVSIYHLVLL